MNQTKIHKTSFNFLTCNFARIMQLLTLDEIRFWIVADVAGFAVEDFDSMLFVSVWDHQTFGGEWVEAFWTFDGASDIFGDVKFLAFEHFLFSPEDIITLATPKSLAETVESIFVSVQRFPAEKVATAKVFGANEFLRVVVRVFFSFWFVLDNTFWL